MQPNKNAPHYIGETPEMVAAFDIYVKLGEKRSIAAVAEKLQRSKSTVTNWCKRFEWKLRLQQWQEEEAARAKEEIKGQFFKDAENLRGYKYELLELLKEKVALGRYCGACEQSPASISEICRVLEVVKTELGEPTSIAKGTFKEDKENPFAGIFNSFFGKSDDESAVKAD